MKLFYLIFTCCFPHFHLWAYLEIIFVRMKRYNSCYSVERILEKYLDRRYQVCVFERPILDDVGVVSDDDDDDDDDDEDDDDDGDEYY